MLASPLLVSAFSADAYVLGCSEMTQDPDSVKDNEKQKSALSGPEALSEIDLD